MCSSQVPEKLGGVILMWYLNVVSAHVVASVLVVLVDVSGAVDDLSCHFHGNLFRRVSS